MPAAPEIRNVVLILADQHRSDCIGCYGNPVVWTPHIDALAARGVRFTQAYTVAAICTPARASIQTGLAPRNHGLIFNWEFWKCRGGEWNLSPRTRCFAQDLAEAGLALGHFGKWHIGDRNRPADYGYEGPYYPGYGYPDKHEHYLAWLRRFGLDGFLLKDEKFDPTGQRLYYATQVGPTEASIPYYLAEQTVEHIRRSSAAGRPFFASCNFWGPHAPYRIPDPHLHMYDPSTIRPWANFHADLSQKPYMMQRQAQVFRTEWFDDAALADFIAKEYGYITLIDEQVGRIVAALRECGELARTLIVYTADHGSALGSYRMWDKGFGMYDCLWRIPMIAAHPALRPGTSDAMVSLLDLAPTFCDAVGATVRDELDGDSLLPMLRGHADRPTRRERSAIQADHVIAEAYGHQIPFWQRMVRTRDAKYIYNPTDRDEFYDLANDPDEMYNIIDSVDRETLRSMRETLWRHILATNDPVRGMAQASLP
jgi:arylsulfatase A-like enzyme